MLVAVDWTRMRRGHCSMITWGLGRLVGLFLASMTSLISDSDIVFCGGKALNDDDNDDEDEDEDGDGDGDNVEQGTSRV